ncbi:Uncharacterised protein [Mycobacteroides abscessus subsp. abscessus]|nr:Uncharacterised protein [Mycobacteroides abscessus subsp. abscessus]
MCAPLSCMLRCRARARSATVMFSVTSTSSMIEEVKSPITRSMSGCTGSRWNSGTFSRKRLCADQPPITSANTAASAMAGVMPRSWAAVVADGPVRVGALGDRHGGQLGRARQLR